MSSTSNQQLKVLVDALKKLRRGSGLTRARLSKSRLLIDALARYRGQESISEPEAYETLIAILEGLPPGRTTQALRNALRLDPKTADDITTRRENFASNVGKNSDTIENWENEAILEVACRLSGQPSIGPATETDSPQVDSPRAATGYEYETIERITSYRGRFLKEVLITRTARATIDGIENIIVWFTPKRDAEADHIRFEAYTNCEVASVRYDKNGTVEAAIKIPRLKRGEQHTFSYKVISTEDRFEATPYFKWWPNEDNRTGRLVVKIQFDHSAIPTEMWRLDGLIRQLSSGNAATCPELKPNEYGFVQAEFTELIIGRCYGIAWHWPPKQE